jgi:NAD(P)-dependent dehydrogenase (short-subunit alcohol dehydrogenase family)
VTLRGRRLLVTGGTGALGGALVRLLLEQGAQVGLSWRGSDSAWTKLRAEWPADAQVWGAAVDLGERDVVASFVARATEALGGLDGVACLAGAYAGQGTFHESALDEWDAMLRVNLESTQAVCRAALPLLPRGGTLVTVSARLVASGGAGAAAYTVSKAAVEALTRAIAAENRARGVRANCVAPALLDTPANRAAMPTADRSQWTPPEQAAEVIAFLLSPASAPVTGALVPIDTRG